MKKILLVLFNLFFIINSTFAFNFTLFSKSAKNTNPEIKLSKDEKNRIGKIEFYPHNQILKPTDEGQKLVIHSDPFSSMQDDVIFIARKGDEVAVSHVLFSSKIKLACLLVTIPSGKSGFIYISENPYANGQFGFKEELVVKEKIVKILNLNRKYTFEGFPNKPVLIHKLPDSSSEIIAEFDRDFRLETQAITEDYKWLNVMYENQSAWINTDFLCNGSGGPIVNTPEEMICEELLWAGYR